jgi:ribosomal protein S18 acetylase RimI-like enzyme
MIKQINANDSETVYKLNQIIFASEITYTQDFIAKFCNEGRGFLLLKNKVPVGYVLYAIASSEDNYFKTVLTIVSLGIIKEYRRNGYADKLLKKVIKIFGQYDMNLNVRLTNLGAQKLYLNHGFKINSIKKNYYWQLNDDGIHMIRKASVKKNISHI